MTFRSILPAILWAAFILILCGIPGNRLPEVSFWQWLKPDKIVHLLAFGVQSYLLIRAFRSSRSGSWINTYAVFLALVISISYGALVEVLQETIFIKRNGDVRDALANAIGAFAGWYVYRLREKKT